MRTDSELRSEFRSALEAVTPNAPWLSDTVSKGLRTRVSTKRGDRAPFQLRFRLNVIALVVLIGFAVAAVGLYLTIHQAPVPARPVVRPIVGHVLSPNYMVTATTGWSWVEPSSELWRTTDGGAHWTNVNRPFVPDRLAPDTDTFFLLDATHAWVTESGQGGSAGPYTTTFRTIDGGKTWHEGQSVLGQSPQLFFIDQNHGWLLLATPDASASLYSTDDAGLHWNFKSSAPGSVRPTGIFAPSAITFSSLTTGWISGENLMVTHDGGVTWQIQPLPVTLTDVSEIGLQFFDPQHGIAYLWPSPPSASSPLKLLVTSDGGTTWVVRSVPLSIPGEIGLQWPAGFVDANHGWVIAGSVTDLNAVPGVSLPLYTTDDGGLTWVRVPTNVVWNSSEDSRVGPIADIRFVDRNNGFAVRRGYRGQGNAQWLTTTDGGRTWTVIVEAPQTP